MSGNSGNGFVTSSWGSPAWEFITFAAYGFPVDPNSFDRDNGDPVGTTKTRYKTFFTSIGDILPCKFCRDSYRIFIKEIPIRLGSRDELTYWLWQIHEKVNEKLGKSSMRYEDVQKKYEGFRAECSSKQTSGLGCTKPADKKAPVKCIIIYTRCPSFSTCFLVSIVVLVILRIVYKKAGLTSYF